MSRKLLLSTRLLSKQIKQLSFNPFRLGSRSLSSPTNVESLQTPKLGASSLFDSLVPVEKTKETSATNETSKKIMQQNFWEPIKFAKHADPTSKQILVSTGNFRIGPRKLNLLARQIKGLTAHEALLQMKFSRKKAALNTRKAITQAIDSATKQKHLDPKKLEIAQAWVGKGLYQKQIDIKGRGRFGMRTRYSAHMKILVAEREPLPKISKPERIWREKSLWVPLVENKPIYNPRPFYPDWYAKKSQM